MPQPGDVAEYQATLGALQDALRARLRDVWAGWPWDTDDSVTTVDAAVQAVPGVVWAFQDVAAGLAADTYDSWRDVEGARGRFKAVLAPLSPESQVLAGVRNALGSLFGPDPDVEQARARLAGSAARLVGHAAADTIVESVHRDPQSVGWRRVLGDPDCRYCQMLAGGLYERGSRARFVSHDADPCTAVPEWSWDGPVASTVALLASDPGRTAADRAKVRAHLAR